ncbi:RNA N6-adenosine-methyltransferase mettl16-like [Patiria miniata]|uniref:RNA N(6)-adenosine-methyltransferase METTL16 n=1 Tax=Patiria miniata TaxID=46514 RepID=A0A913ZWS0_PATMI|nr:RNA N6-adenosine-methyltransferase mettl16-like [Patiria miniata]XP_038055959.1 RNA N6-adenosine-methyltransferase mettl16-like [Patiria miniata]
MALNQFMHPRNRYKHKKPDFAALADKYPDFKRHLSTTLTGYVSLDFKDPEALRSLTCTLLREDFGIDLMIPLDRIIPTVPLRLNYVLWIEDLLEQSGHGRSGEIYGIDVGCGASCIYPLLGAKLNDWHFAASEVDSSSAGFAVLNVKRNNLNDKIHVIEAEPDDMLHGIVKAAPRSLYHFSMCNPPFFGNLLEAQGIMTSRTVDRSEPISVSTAAEAEMIWGEGGEVDFVGRMIRDSLQLREQVVWYTSMVGKKASIGPIRKELAKHKIRNVMTTEFCQGRTMRWGIAWTFYDDIKLPVLSPAKKFKRDKERPPLVIEVPDRALQQALKEVSPGSKVKTGGSEDQRKVKTIAKVMEKLLGTLEIDFKSKSAPKLCSRYALTAHRNTWAKQRWKRRQMSRRLPQEAPPIPDATTMRSCPEPTEVRPACDNAPGRPTNAKPNVGEGSSGKDAELVGENTAEKLHMLYESQELASAEMERSGDSGCMTVHDRSLPIHSSRQILCHTEKDSSGSVSQVTGSNEDSLVRAVSQETSCDTSKEQGCISDDDSIQNSKVMLESRESSADKPGNVESKTGRISSPEGSRQEIGHSTNPNVALKEPTINTSSDTDSSEGQPGQISPPEDSKQEIGHSTNPNVALKEPTINTSSDTDSSEGQPGQISPPEDSKQETGHSANPNMALKEPTTNTSSTDIDSSEGQPGQLSPPEGSRLGAECLFKCMLTVKITDGKVVVELSWTEGRSREALHQVGQYIKNHLNKMS